MNEPDQFKDLLARMKGPNAFSVERAYEEALGLFEAIVAELAGASLERKEELVTQLQQMEALANNEVPDLYNKVSMSEEELSAYTQNSQFFMPEEWKLLSSMRKRLNGLAEASAKALSASLLGKESLKTARKAGKTIRPRQDKSRWMKP